MDIHKAPSHKGKSRIGRAVKFFKKNKHSIKNSRTLAHLRDRITKWRGGPRGITLPCTHLEKTSTKSHPQSRKNHSTKFQLTGFVILTIFVINILNSSSSVHQVISHSGDSDKFFFSLTGTHQFISLFTLGNIQKII